LITRSTAFFAPAGGRIGIIGLDTSHSTAFTKALNEQAKGGRNEGFRVVAAYPHGSPDIESSVKRIPAYTEEVRKYGVEIVASIDELLKRVDFVLLETNDGRPHLAQALQVMKAGKPMFIDKPVAGSLSDAIAIYEASERYKVPVFSSSSLRYMDTAQEAAAGKVGKILGADTYSPATLEKTHPDLFWYGIHGVEILFTVMGTGCGEVTRSGTQGTDIVVGKWKDGRVGTFRGTRTGKHDYGGTAYGEKGNLTLGPFKAYDNLLDRIIEFFRTGQPPVTAAETLEIYTFMEAADESKRKGGKAVSMEQVYAHNLKKN
jgi:predicted dehydrogenase